MKICPKCNQQYEDANLNFCLSDGELLMETEEADPTPTVYMDAPRVTKRNWETGPAVDPLPEDKQNQQIFQQPFAGQQNYPTVITKDKTMATVSLVLGILSLVLICCYLGIPLGASAGITGFIAMSRVNSDPQTYAGKELAIVGMVLGGMSLIGSFLLIIAAILSG